jgi:riboflavin synthase alpha subunit
VFTGIVRELGRVAETGGGPDGRTLVVEAAQAAARAQEGDSIAVDGCCLTVVAADPPRLGFDLVPETLARTTLGRLRPGDAVNVEPALRAGEPLGGHFVQGHVDAVGQVRSVEPEGAGLRVVVEAPAGVLRYCVEKGSIAVDGVSLTIAAVAEDAFAVALVPHTLRATTLASLVPGREVNLEADVLAKYAERLLPVTIRP